MLILDGLLYKVGIAAAIFFSVVCLLGLIADVRRRRRLQRQDQRNEELGIARPQMFNNRQNVDNLDWTFPITLNCVDKVTTRDEFQLFFVQPCGIQASYPIPRNQDKSYFEIKILDILDGQELFVGLAPKNQNETVIPGVGDDSVSISSKEGSILLSGKSIYWINGKKFGSGDVIGCLITNSSPTNICFTHNGELLDPIPMVRNSIPVFPSLYSSGQAHIQFNFGHTEFLFSKANLFRYGLVSTSTLSELPPAYENDVALPTSTFNNPNTSAPQYPL